MLHRYVRPAGLLAFAACAGGQPTPAPEPHMDPARPERAPVVAPPPPPPVRAPIIPASEAAGRGLMPLASTGVWSYRRSNPTWDGRGVLIAILDSGIDPSVPGLDKTATGDPKLIDLRDFSGEGRIALTAVKPRGDSIDVGGVMLGGMSRVAALSGSGPYLAGRLAERLLGELPASDLDGDGGNDDELAVVLTRASDGWVVFADTDGDGTLEDERPVHDYLQGRETIAWHTADRPSPVAVAVNVSDSAGGPVLDLLFDTSAHGTHVAGIAAGASLYGVSGFDGVAPGAQLLGLKIANNAHGGISVTGSMLRAMDYAIRFAKQRSVPLVMNLSFGVGNEAEGAARIDAIVDSVLAANPDIVLVTSAGNDGPGISTMGFPASAGRAITVGATLPMSFVESTRPDGDVVAFFSSRGGELAKPDVMAPGIAYSSVPRWSTGEEIKNGTSMASPHVAGAVALLMSAAKQDGRALTARQVKQALEATARPMPDALPVDQGAGLLDIVAADELIRRLPAIATMRAWIGPSQAGSAYHVMASAGPDSTVVLTLEGGLPGPIRLVSDQPWFAVPRTATVTPPLSTVPATLDLGAIAEPGVHTATVTGWASDTTIGPLFRATATIVKPTAIPDSGLVVSGTLPPAGNQRVFFVADTARPFRVTVASRARPEKVYAFLHEPGGQPSRGGGSGQEAGPGEQAIELEIDARDLIPGVYEVVGAAPPGRPAGVEIKVQRSPLAFGAARGLKDSVRAWFSNRTGAPVSASALFGLQGAERRVRFSQRGGAERRIPFAVPAWATRVVVDLALPREQWPLFTDLGLSVVDADGRVLEASPQNYALGRLELDLPEKGERELTVLISPGFADPVPAAMWEGDVSIKLYAESPVLVPTPALGDLSVGPGATITRSFPLGAIPWPLGDGFFPLGNLVVDASGALWGRETPLPEPQPPAMR